MEANDGPSGKGKGRQTDSQDARIPDASTSDDGDTAPDPGVVDDTASDDNDESPNVAETLDSDEENVPPEEDAEEAASRKQSLDLKTAAALTKTNTKLNVEISKPRRSSHGKQALSMSSLAGGHIGGQATASGSGHQDSASGIQASTPGTHGASSIRTKMKLLVGRIKPKNNQSTASSQSADHGEQHPVSAGSQDPTVDFHQQVEVKEADTSPDGDTPADLPLSPVRTEELQPGGEVPDEATREKRKIEQAQKAHADDIERRIAKSRRERSSTNLQGEASSPGAPVDVDEQRWLQYIRGQESGPSSDNVHSSQEPSADQDDSRSQHHEHGSSADREFSVTPASQNSEDSTTSTQAAQPLRGASMNNENRPPSSHTDAISATGGPETSNTGDHRATPGEFPFFLELLVQLTKENV